MSGIVKLAIEPTTPIQTFVATTRAIGNANGLLTIDEMKNGLFVSTGAALDAPRTLTTPTAELIFLGLQTVYKSLGNQRLYSMIFVYERQQAGGDLVTLTAGAGCTIIGTATIAAATATAYRVDACSYKKNDGTFQYGCSITRLG